MTTTEETKVLERELEDATDVLLNLMYSAQRVAAKQPDCDNLLRDLLRASEWLRMRGVRR